MYINQKNKFLKVRVNRNKQLSGFVAFPPPPVNVYVSRKKDALY